MSLVWGSKNYQSFSWLTRQGRKRNRGTPEVLQLCPGWSRFPSPFCSGSHGTLSKIILLLEISVI